MAVEPLFKNYKKTIYFNFGMIVNTVQCHSICVYLLPLHVSVS
jgi:hypothetical protein